MFAENNTFKICEQLMHFNSQFKTSCLSTFGIHVLVARPKIICLHALNGLWHDWHKIGASRQGIYRPTSDRLASSSFLFFNSKPSKSWDLLPSQRQDTRSVGYSEVSPAFRRWFGQITPSSLIQLWSGGVFLRVFAEILDTLHEIEKQTNIPWSRQFHFIILICGLLVKS